MKKDQQNSTLKLSLCLFAIFALTMGGDLLFAQTQKKADSADRSNELLPVTEAELVELLKQPLSLKSCIRIALTKNIQLDIAKLDLESAQASLSGSYSSFMPMFALEGTQSRQNQIRPPDTSDPTALSDLQFDNQGAVASFTQKLLTNASFVASGDLRKDTNSPDQFGQAPERTENREYSFQLTQPLLRDAWISMAKSPVNRARYGYEMQEKVLNGTKLTTIFNLKMAFYEIVLQREIMKANRSALVRDSALVRLSEAKYRASLATRRDVLSAEIQIADDQASLIAAEADYEAALDQLKDVMGIPIRVPIYIENVELDYSSEKLIAEDLIKLALENNPMIQNNEISVKRIDLERRIAKNQKLPQVDLFVKYLNTFDKNLAQVTNIKNNDWQMGINFSYSFLDKASGAAAQNAEISLAAQRASLKDQRRKIVLAVRNITRKAFSAGKEIEALKKTIEAANEKVRFATTMFDLGRASNLDITDAQQALLKSQIQYAKKVTDYHMLIAELETLIGQQIVY